jgi:uncharacterized alpha-E superfamily protein
MLSKANRLFWLGRYNERVLTTLKYILALYDKSIENEIDVDEFCNKLNIPNTYADNKTFFERYLFDKTDQNSVVSNADRMLGNGMVLRETLTTETLSYLQMAINALDMAAKNNHPGIEAQWVIDDIMAFRGSFDDKMENKIERNIIKCGIGVERITLFLQFNNPQKVIFYEIEKLLSRSFKTGLSTNYDCRTVLNNSISNSICETSVILPAIEGLFEV